MKKLLQFLVQGLLPVLAVVSASTGLLAQPANDSCIHATVLPVLQTKVYQSYTVDVGYIEAGAPARSSCRPAQAPTNDVWFKATNTSPGVILNFKKSHTASGSPIVEVYHGSCGSLIYDTCKRWISPDSFVYVFDLPANTTWYIRVIDYAPNQNYSYQIQLSAQTKPGPKRVISNRLTGPWSDPASWVGNIAPTFSDTVVIDDGSTISAGVADIISPAKIIVGQADTTLQARLAVAWDGFSRLTLPDSLIINTRDILQISGNYPELYLNSSLKLNGELKSMSSDADIAFIKAGRQSIAGRGALTGYWGLTMNKPDTLFQNMPLYLTNNVYLKAGLLLSKAPVVLNGAQLHVQRGVLSHPTLQITPPYVLYLANGDGSCNGGVDSSIHIDRYIGSGNQVYFQAQRRAADTCYMSGNKTFAEIGMSNNFTSIIKGGPNDTVFTGYCSSSSTYNSNSYNAGFWLGAMVFNPLVSVGLSIPDTTFFPLYSQGRQRQLSLSNAKAFERPHQTLTVSVLNQAPSGPAGGSLNAVQGSFVFKINSNLDTLPAPCKLRFYYTPADSLKGTPYNYRIAQSHSPNGPWYSVSPTFGAANSNSVTTTDMLSFDNGTYFCFATLDYLGVPAQAATRQAFTLYPNPATHTLNITSLPSQSAPLFYNTVGQLLQVPMQSKPGLWQADVQSLPKGLYLVYYAGQVSKVVKE